MARQAEKPFSVFEVTRGRPLSGYAGLRLGPRGTNVPQVKSRTARRSYYTWGLLAGRGKGFVRPWLPNERRNAGSYAKAYEAGYARTRAIKGTPGFGRRTGPVVLRRGVGRNVGSFKGRAGQWQKGEGGRFIGSK